MNKEKWYKSSWFLWAVFFSIILGAIIGLTTPHYFKVPISFSNGSFSSGNWQCVEWKNETSIVYKGYIYGSKNSTWEEISKLIPIDFGFYKNEEGYMEEGRLVLFEEDFVTNNIKIYWYVFESQSDQVCVKEGNCKEKYLVECYAPFDIELFASYDRATNYCMSPFKLTTYKICKEYR